MLPHPQHNADWREKRSWFFRRMDIRFLTPLIGSATGYAIFARSLESWAHYVPRITIVTFGLLTYVVLRAMYADAGHKKLNLIQMLVIFISMVGTSIMAAAAYYGVGVAAVDLYRFTTTSSPKMVAFATVSAGSVLFLFRLKARAVYGLTEAVAGIAVAMHRAPQGDIASLSWDSTFFLAILTAGVYLVVRGLDNIHQGLTKDPKDVIVSKIVQFVSEKLQKMSGENAAVRIRANRAHLAADQSRSKGSNDL